MSSEQGTQKVHSKLQMQAAPVLGVGPSHFSQFSFISSMLALSLVWRIGPTMPKDWLLIQTQFVIILRANKFGPEERTYGAIHRAG